jgi:hypothetical protein
MGRLQIPQTNLRIGCMWAACSTVLKISSRFLFQEWSRLVSTAPGRHDESLHGAALLAGHHKESVHRGHAAIAAAFDILRLVEVQ